MTRLRFTLPIVAFAFATFLGAKLTLPAAIPITLQTPVVLLSGAFLGAHRGALSQVLYLAAGAVGLPMFAKPPFGGLDYFVTTPTAGYLLGFPIAALVVGAILDRDQPTHSLLRQTSLALLAFATGMAVIFACGSVGLWWSGMSWSAAWQRGVAALQLWSGVKLLLVLAIYTGFRPRQRHPTT